MNKKKILKKSISALISASMILCSCLQTYAKINIDIDKQKILNNAKKAGKYVIPFGAALATGFAIGIGYGKFNKKREKSKSYGMYTDYVLSNFNFLNSIKKQQEPRKLIANKNAYNALYSKITTVEGCPGYVSIWSLIVKTVSIPIRTGDKILAIGQLNGDIHKTKEAVIKAVEHITKNNGKVIFLGNIISDTNIENNLECLLALAELKSTFSQVMIMKGDREREFVENKDKFLNGDKYKKKGINYDKIEQMVYPFIKDGTYDNNIIVINKHTAKSDNNDKQILTITTNTDKDSPNTNDPTLIKLSPSDIYQYVTVE